jgi:hypothetical protein
MFGGFAWLFLLDCAQYGLGVAMALGLGALQFCFSDPQSSVML